MPDLDPKDLFSLEAIKTIAQEIRESFAMGFDKALDFYKLSHQPPPAQPQEREVPPEPWTDEDELTPGMIDLRTLNEHTPEARAAILAAHGLQPLRPGRDEYDPTAEVMQDTIQRDGMAPPATADPEEDG